MSGLTLAQHLAAILIHTVDPYYYPDGEAQLARDLQDAIDAYEEKPE